MVGPSGFFQSVQIEQSERGRGKRDKNLYPAEKGGRVDAQPRESLAASKLGFSKGGGQNSFSGHEKKAVGSLRVP